MTYRPGQHMYLASGFFNDKQRDLCDFIEGLERMPHMPIYSPRKDGGVLRPDSPPNQIKEVFDSNKISIETANFVLAVIDDYDAGVLWEMGYAHGKNISTLGYSDVEGRGLNVMLAGGCNLGFVNGREALKKTLIDWGDLKFDAFPRNTWSGAIQ